MAVKYRCDYYNYFNNLCRVDISLASYVGEPILVRGVGDQACVISRDIGDDPYDPIVSTTANISIYQEDVALIDVQELQQASDRSFIVEVYVSGGLKFKGFVVPDGIQRPVKGKPFDLNITATDGLMLLSGIDYIHNNLTGGRCIINYFRQILFSDNNLGLTLPIKWVSSITNDQYPLEEDIFSGSMIWSSRGEGFTDYNGNIKTCMYIIDGMLRSMQSRIVQCDGEWVIWRINDVTTGSFLYRSTPATLDDFDIVTGEVESHLKTIEWNDTANYRAINEDHISITNKGLKTVITKYEQDQRENVLPNGNMDIVDGTLNVPIYWGVGSGGAYMESVGSLSDNTGSAVKITNDLSNPAAALELLDVYLPIDTEVLYKYINFGFKFMITSGAVTDPDGFIVWDSTPFILQILYTAGSTVFYLNEFGFWTTTYTEIKITVDNLKLGDVASIDFNRRQNILMPSPSVVPIGQTTRPALDVLFIIPPGRVVTYDDIYINVDSNSDVYEAVQSSSTNTGKEEYNLNISSSHNGFYVSNFMTNYSQSGLEKFYSDSKITGATLTEMNSHAILRNRYKAAELFEGSIYAELYSYCEIYEIETFGTKKFLPLKSSWNTETCITTLSAVEVRDDGEGITTKHYGSNDKTALSN